MGLWYREQFLCRLKVLKQLEEILEMFMSEIRYGKATLPECCMRMGERLKEPYGSCFVHIYQRMKENTGVGFGEVFSEEMGECLSRFPLTEEDKTEFLRFAAENSFAEGAMQLKRMESGREQLRRTVEVLERETAEKCRVAVGLGAMSGLLLVIILL